MANENELDLSGRFFIVKNTTTGKVYLNEYVDSIKYFRTGDNFVFLPSAVQTNNSELINQSKLGDGLNTFDSNLTLDPDTGIKFVDGDTMEAWIVANVGFFTGNPTGLLTQDFLIEVKKGNVIGHSLVEKFGAASAIPNTLTVIASANIYQTPTAITALEIVSDDNTNDIAAGTGARSVEIFGIGTGYVEVSETVALNGTTAAALVNSYYRIYRAKVKTSGQYSSPTQSSHNSVITIQGTGGGAVWAEIQKEGTFGLGQSEIGAYTIPAGKTGYLLSKNIGFESSKNASVFMFVRDQIDVVAAPFGAMRSLELDRNINTRIDVTARGVLAVLDEKTDVGFMAKSITGTTALSVDFEILLIDN